MAQLDSYLRTDLKPRHLHLLVALDNIRNLGRVAETMHVTQPAVSKSLAELERGVGLRLFERTSRGVFPTIYGECLIRHARSMLTDLAQARDELHGLASGSSGNIRVGVLATAALALLPRALAMLKSHHPGMTVLVREGLMENLLPELLLGNLDLLVGRLPEDRIAQGLNEKILMDEGVSLVAGRHHPLAGRKRVNWSDLLAFPWVFPPVNTLLREPLERAFERHGVPMPSNRVETLSVHVMRGYLHFTDAIGVLATDVSRYYESLGLLAILPLELPRLARPVGVVWSRERPLAPATQMLIQCMEEAVHAGARPAEPLPAPDRVTVASETRQNFPAASRAAARKQKARK